MEERIVIDVPMPFSYVNKDFLKQLELLEPFGMGNQKPVFAQKNLSFLTMQKMGKQKNMAKFSVSDEEGRRFSVILFKELEQFLSDVEKKYGKHELQELVNSTGKSKIKMNIIYYPSLNEFRGETQLQFVMQQWN